MDSLLRRLFLYLSGAGWARGIVTRWGAARGMAMRFVAGENVTDALATALALNKKGLLVTLDYLGESVTSEADTQAVVKTYRDLLAGITTQDAQASVSLKLTHLGLDISEELCIANLRHLLGEAKARGILVTIDMESSAYTDRTLRIYRTLRDEYEFDNVGTVIQAYLYRSKQDMAELATEGAHIRLCKGAYLEPAEVAFPEKADVDKQYLDLMTDYLQAPPPAYLCIATHDEKMIMAAEKLIDKRSAMSSRCEFQMLYGIRASRQEQLVAEGYPVRIYLPFGEAWYPYFMRRLAERPANVWFFIRSLVRK
jgi:proline dehydrogenase